MVIQVIEISLAIIPIGVILYLYAVTALKLRWYLDKYYPEFVDRSDFPVKMSKRMYRATLGTGANWIRFVYSDNHLNDPEIKRLKAHNKAVILAAIIWLAVFSGFVLVLDGTG